jgi:hypothetical protein
MRYGRRPVHRAPCFLLIAVLSACSAGAPDDPLVVGPGEARDDLKADGASSGERAELKVLVEADAIDPVRERLGLDGDLAEERAVWFYDTAALDLFEAGAILRARSVHRGDDDSTVKIRPLAADEVDPAWFAEAGFKCELDAGLASATWSCSFTIEQEEDQIEEVADGERDLDTLFSSEQEDFAAAYAPPFDWHELVPLGPIDALVWKVESRRLPSALTAEHWRLPDQEMLEVSIKVDAGEAEEGMSALLDWLAEHDVPAAAAQDSKTRRALESLRAAELGDARER